MNHDALPKKQVYGARGGPPLAAPGTLILRIGTQFPKASEGLIRPWDYPNLDLDHYLDHYLELDLDHDLELDHDHDLDHDPDLDHDLEHDPDLDLDLVLDHPHRKFEVTGCGIAISERIPSAAHIERASPLSSSQSAAIK